MTDRDIDPRSVSVTPLLMKINTAGSASAACNNNKRKGAASLCSDGSRNAQACVHKGNILSDEIGMDGMEWIRLYSLPIILSKTGIKNKKKKVILGSHRRSASR